MSPFVASVATAFFGLTNFFGFDLPFFDEPPRQERFEQQFQSGQLQPLGEFTEEARQWRPESSDGRPPEAPPSDPSLQSGLSSQAFEVCSGETDEASCDFNTPRGPVFGKCQTTPQGLACMPTDDPQPI